jgi:hypothetical protein
LVAVPEEGAMIEARAWTRPTPERYVANIFVKLGLPQTEGDNRRVLAVLRYLDSPAG